MKGVKFGTFHTFDDWGLICSEKTIGSPAPKVRQIDVEGGDGVLDYTEFFGETKFTNRPLSFTFSKGSLSTEDFLTLFTTIQNAIHGQRLKIIIDENPGFFYMGRVTVSEWKLKKSIGTMVIDVDAEPWKYNLTETVVSRSISGSTAVNLINGRKRAVPTITANASMTFAFGGNSYSASSGTYIIPELELVEGSNQINVTGSGTVTFRYQEGGL